MADVVEMVGQGSTAAYAKQAIADQRIGHKEYMETTATICRRFGNGNGAASKPPLKSHERATPRTLVDPTW